MKAQNTYFPSQIYLKFTGTTHLGTKWKNLKINLQCQTVTVITRPRVCPTGAGVPAGVFAKSQPSLSSVMPVYLLLHILLYFFSQYLNCFHSLLLFSSLDISLISSSGQIPDISLGIIQYKTQYGPFLFICLTCVIFVLYCWVAWCLAG